MRALGSTKRLNKGLIQEDKQQKSCAEFPMPWTQHHSTSDGGQLALNEKKNKQDPRIGNDKTLIV